MTLRWWMRCHDLKISIKIKHHEANTICLGMHVDVKKPIDISAINDESADCLQNRSHLQALQSLLPEQQSIVYTSMFFFICAFGMESKVGLYPIIHKKDPCGSASEVIVSHKLSNHCLYREKPMCRSVVQRGQHECKSLITWIHFVNQTYANSSEEIPNLVQRTVSHQCVHDIG